MQPPINRIPQQPIIAAQQKSPNRAYVSFSAEIIPHTTESLIATCSNLSNQGVKEIYLIRASDPDMRHSGLPILGGSRRLAQQDAPMGRRQKVELLKRIEELLRQRDVTSVTIDDDGLLFQAKCDPTSIRIRISISDAALVVRGFIPFFVPANRRQAICEAINLCNWQLRYVRFEMDASDGELRCWGDMPRFDGVPTGKQLTNLIYAVWSNTERYAPALLQVMVAGADPALAIGLAEENEGFNGIEAAPIKTVVI
jgi:hypothetical protein